MIKKKDKHIDYTSVNLKYPNHGAAKVVFPVNIKQKIKDN